MDWSLSPVGQQALAEALLLHSPRDDVPAPAGSVPLKDMKLLIPADWNAFEKDRAEFAKEWDRIVGARCSAGLDVADPRAPAASSQLAGAHPTWDPTTRR